MMMFRKGYNFHIAFVVLIVTLICIDFSHSEPALRVPIDTSQTKKRISRYINPELLSLNIPGKPNIIDKDKRRITLREGGIVAAYKSYSVASGGDHITSCCFCIIKNIRTGHYAAAHIMGHVFNYQEIDFAYKFPDKAIPKMISFLKALDPNMKREDLAAVIIGGGDQYETMQELALENFNDLKRALKKAGISIVGEEPVSEYKKMFRFPGSDKVYIKHSGDFRFSIQDDIRAIESDFRRDKDFKSIKTDIDTREEIYTVLVTKETSLLWRGGISKTVAEQNLKKESCLKAYTGYPANEKFELILRKVLEGKVVYPEDISQRFSSYFEIRDSRYDGALAVINKDDLVFCDVQPGFFVICEDAKENDVIGSGYPFSGCIACIFKGEMKGRTVVAFGHIAQPRKFLKFILDKVESLNLENPYIYFQASETDKKEIEDVVSNASTKTFPTIFKARQSERLDITKREGGNTRIISTMGGIVVHDEGKAPVSKLWEEIYSLPPVVNAVETLRKMGRDAPSFL